MLDRTPIHNERLPAADHAVEIEQLPHSPTASTIRYLVLHAGAQLIASTRDPAFDACRALMVLGLTGKTSPTASEARRPA